MFIDVSQRKALEKFTVSQRILILNFYVQFIRRLYYLLLENFLEKMIIIRSYRRTMILSTSQRYQEHGKKKIFSYNRRCRIRQIRLQKRFPIWSGYLCSSNRGGSLRRWPWENRMGKICGGKARVHTR